VQQLAKTKQLLAFLQNFATLRRKRVTAYGSGDKVLWLAVLPNALAYGWTDALKVAIGPRLRSWNSRIREKRGVNLRSSLVKTG